MRIEKHCPSTWWKVNIVVDHSYDDLWTVSHGRCKTTRNCNYTAALWTAQIGMWQQVHDIVISNCRAGDSWFLQLRGRSEFMTWGEVEVLTQTASHVSSVITTNKKVRQNLKGLVFNKLAQQASLQQYPLTCCMRPWLHNGCTDPILEENPYLFVMTQGRFGSFTVPPNANICFPVFISKT